MDDLIECYLIIDSIQFYYTSKHDGVCVIQVDNYFKGNSYKPVKKVYGIGKPINRLETKISNLEMPIKNGYLFEKVDSIIYFVAIEERTDIKIIWDTRNTISLVDFIEKRVHAIDAIDKTLKSRIIWKLENDHGYWRNAVN